MIQTYLLLCFLNIMLKGKEKEYSESGLNKTYQEYICFQSKYILIYPFTILSESETLFPK